MSRQERQLLEKAREESMHKRTLRRNQVIFAVLSGFLIISMLLSLIKF